MYTQKVPFLLVFSSEGFFSIFGLAFIGAMDDATNVQEMV